MAKAKTLINGKTVEELYEMIRNGEKPPAGTCRDYTKNPPFYECGNEEQHMALEDLTVVSFGNASAANPEFAVAEDAEEE